MTKNKGKSKTKEKLALRKIIKQFRTRTKVVISIWTIFNLIFFVFYTFGASAPITKSLVIFVIWELVIWVYYIHKYHYKKIHKSGDWVNAILFAIIAATVIRTFFIEAYKIPTSSMEKSLRVGDFLFVSKINYGARLPITPISVPFVHQNLFGVKAYSEALKMPYFRTKGLQKIKRRDIVVFNWPAEPDGRPADKKMNYIKRCVAIPGDTISIQDGYVHIDGNMEDFPQDGQFEYRVYTKGKSLNPKKLFKLDVTDFNRGAGMSDLHLSQASKENVEKSFNPDSVLRKTYPIGTTDSYLFPTDTAVMGKWNRDYMEAIYVPEKGESIAINKNNYPIYEKIIKEYEGNQNAYLSNNRLVIDGEFTEKYTFKMNYYFMMGDNRHNSLDSRFWGFVPEDHIVGKPLFIWFSLKYETYNGNYNPPKNQLRGIRFNRIFKRVK
ncbi:MAG: Signal peptidase I [Bacteroidetes bacterium MED-G17]|nr:MAG: Signal peptidase I [Bacteroidetes bacterium MED-G17]|tara:strand:+ start:4962 stop:6275 length:1314 start_codon:yes stop_codon:yes gene_type:complete